MVFLYAIITKNGDDYLLVTNVEYEDLNSETNHTMNMYQYPTEDPSPVREALVAFFNAHVTYATDNWEFALRNTTGWVKYLGRMQPTAITNLKKINK